MPRRLQDLRHPWEYAHTTWPDGPFDLAGDDEARAAARAARIAKLLRRHRGGRMGLRDDELAFYDAVYQNDSAVLELGDETLRTIATELVRIVKNSATIDWARKDTVRAKMRASVKRLLLRYKYPPDKAEAAIETVIAQAELMANGSVST
jgi:type I restriction enzyme R subunit